MCRYFFQIQVHDVGIHDDIYEPPMENSLATNDRCHTPALSVIGNNFYKFTFLSVRHYFFLLHKIVHWRFPFTCFESHVFGFQSIMQKMLTRQRSTCRPLMRIRLYHSQQLLVIFLMLCQSVNEQIHVPQLQLHKRSTIAIWCKVAALIIIARPKTRRSIRPAEQPPAGSAADPFTTPVSTRNNLRRG